MSRHARRSLALMAVAVVVMSWRLWALVVPSSLIEIAAGYRVPLSLLGLLFLGCGSWVAQGRQDLAARLFFLYALGGAVHWGGAPGSVDDRRAAVLLLVYLAVSFVGEASLLRLALLVPRPLASASWAAVRWTPSILGLGTIALIPVALWRPLGSLENPIGLLYLLTTLVSGVALIVFVVRAVVPPVGVGVAERRRLLAAACSVLIATIPYLLVSLELLTGPSELYNLLFGAIPVSLAHLLRSTSVAGRELADGREARGDDGVVPG